MSLYRPKSFLICGDTLNLNKSSVGGSLNVRTTGSGLNSKDSQKIVLRWN